MTNMATNVGGSQWVSNQLVPNQVNSLGELEIGLSGINGEGGTLPVHRRTEKRHYSISLPSGMSASIDPEDWDLLRKLRWRSKKAHHSDIWYAVTGRSVEIRMHRLIMEAKPGETIDHRDGDGLNNRRSNLRRCTNTQNIRNSGLYAANRRPDAKYKGASRMPNGQYRAQIMCQRKKINLGNHSSEERAARAYDVAAAKLFGPFARLNFPDGVAALQGGGT